MRVVLLGVLDPDPQAAKAATLTLYLRHRDAPDHGCGGHMGTAVGLDVDAVDVDDPDQLDVRRQQVARGADITRLM